MATQASLTTIQSLYVAYYGRPADPEGLLFWANQLDNSQGNLAAIINAFGTSDEYTNRFGNNSPSEAVNNLYQQLFGRDAEAEGLAFHVDLITSGQKTLAEIALQISLGAQGGDKTVFEGRTTVADAFTRELNTPEKVAAYSSDRGVDIGQQYLQRVTEQTSSSEVLRDAAPVVGTLLPETPPVTPPGGGVTPPPAPSFTAALDEQGIVTFSGTATGPITLTNGRDWIFSRGELSSTLPSTPAVSQIELGNAALTAQAFSLHTILVNGSGTLSLTDLSEEVDLSNLAASLTVTASITDDIDISSNPHLGSIDTYQVSHNAQLTMSIEQYAGATVQGQAILILSDTISNLLNAGNTVLEAANAINVTDAASVAELIHLADLNNTIHYSSVKDTAEHLIADASTNEGAGTYVTGGVDIVVADEISIDGLQTVYDAVDANSTVIANNLKDTIDHLITDSTVSKFVTPGSNVTVENTASLADIQRIDTANGDGTLTYSLEDSYAHIIAVEAADLVAGATAITLTDYNLGERTVADIQAVLALSNLKNSEGNDIALNDLTYTLLDTSAALSSSLQDVANIVTGAASVTANDDATVSQARTIYERDDNATYNITDSVNSLLSTSGNTQDAVNNAVDLTATNTASASQSQQLHSLTNTGETSYSVSDSYSNITTTSYSDGINNATNLTNTTSLYDVDQAQTLVNFNNAGITSIGFLRDTAANINTFVGNNARSDTLSYNFNVRDSASNILSAIDDNTTFITGNPAEEFNGDARVQQIYLTSSLNVDEAETFWKAVNPVFDEDASTTAQKTTYTIDDDISHYTNALTDEDWVINADVRVIRGTAEEIFQAQTNSSNDSHDIFKLVNASSQDRLNVSASSGNQTIVGGPGSNNISVGDGNDTVYGGASNDTIYGGEGYDRLYGAQGRDTIYAGASASDTTESQHQWWQHNSVVGGPGGDRMFGSTAADIFIYEGNTRAELIAESGTTNTTRDYIHNFSLGDKIYFQNIDSMQFFSSGSANASSVEAGSLGLSVRYEKNANVINWQGNGLEAEASRIFIDIADENGQFNDIADMHIILVGTNIDINWDGTYITFGG